MALQFDHIIVLMLENRSFDHIFGYLGIGEGLPARGAVNYRKPGDSSTTAFRTRNGGDFVGVGQGPAHSLKETNLQLFGKAQVPADTAATTATMDGFVASFQVSLLRDLKRSPTDSELQQVMNCFDPVQLPVPSTLARNFVLCDHWFADVPGPTMPNRAFVHAATSQGYTYNANWRPKFNCATLYDRINGRTDLSWRVYYHDQNDVLELYPNIKSDPTNHVLFEQAFLQDVSRDNLPTYSFVTPAFLGQRAARHHRRRNVRSESRVNHAAAPSGDDQQEERMRAPRAFPLAVTSMLFLILAQSGSLVRTQSARHRCDEAEAESSRYLRTRRVLVCFGGCRSDPAQGRISGPGTSSFVSPGYPPETSKPPGPLETYRKVETPGDRPTQAKGNRTPARIRPHREAAAVPPRVNARPFVQQWRHVLLDKDVRGAGFECLPCTLFLPLRRVVMIHLLSPDRTCEFQLPD